MFEAIIKDTIEHNRNKIIENLNSFDTAATSIVRKIQDSSGKLVDDAFKNIIGTEVRNISMRPVSYTHLQALMRIYFHPNIPHICPADLWR